jgi:4-hydroxythreonine-4-phosphate dehydrogenase
MSAPVALTCGDPAGVGPEIAVAAWRALGTALPFVWIGDPRHLPPLAPVAVIDDLSETAAAAGMGLPVLRLDFAAPATPGAPDLANAAGTVAAIERAVALAR